MRSWRRNKKTDQTSSVGLAEPYSTVHCLCQPYGLDSITQPHLVQSRFLNVFLYSSHALTHEVHLY